MLHAGMLHSDLSAKVLGLNIITVISAAVLHKSLLLVPFSHLLVGVHCGSQMSCTKLHTLNLLNHLNVAGRFQHAADIPCTLCVCDSYVHNRSVSDLQATPV